MYFLFFFRIQDDDEIEKKLEHVDIKNPNEKCVIQ